MSEVLPGIRRLRKKAGLTIEELAAAVGCTRQAAGAWENGIALPTAERLPEIARALGCSIDDLFKNDNSKTEEMP